MNDSKTERNHKIDPSSDTNINLFNHTVAPLKPTLKKDDEALDQGEITDFSVTKTAKDLDWKGICLEIQNLARTPEAKVLAEILEPLPSKEMAAQRFREIGEYQALIEAEQIPPITGLRSLTEVLMRASIGGELTAQEMAKISRNADIIARIASFFHKNQSLAPQLAELADLIDPCSNLRSALTHAIEPGGRISDYASPDLKNLRRVVQTQTERLRDKVDSLLQDQKLEEHLQDDYYTVREGRYVVPVRASSKNTVDGIIHGYSQSGQTAFIEPEILVQLNNGLRWAQIAVEEEESRILTRLSGMVTDSLHALRSNTEIVAYLDLTYAITRFGQLYNGCIPTLLDPPGVPVYANEANATTPPHKTPLRLTALRHPLLHIKFAKMLQEGEENPNVSNDLRIDDDRRTLIVSGPNTGGKTVLLKAFGLAILMMKTGIPVAAASALLPFYGGVYTDIGDEQSIQKDLSTFSAHLVNISHFLPRCGPQTLVLLDELFTGTDPMQGAALAAALLEELSKRGTTTLVTTHLESLKTIALNDDRFANASMGFNLETLEPNYLLTLGVPGSSFALRIADRLGFPSSIIENAREKLAGEGQLGVDLAMAKLEKQAEELRAETNRLQHQRRRSEQAEQKFRKKYDKLAVRDREMVNQRAKELQAELKAADQLIRNKIKELVVDSNVGKQALEHIRETIRLQERVIERVKEQSAKQEIRPDGLLPIPFENLEEGMTVYALNFKRNGVVRHIDQAKRRVQVQVGVMKSYIDVAELFYVGNPTSNSQNTHPTTRPYPQPEREREENGEQVDVLMPQMSDNTVDLRGLDADDAIEKVDLFLDSARRQGIDGVYIIHGFGTGVLRKAVRKFLTQNTRIRKFRAGGRREGGDGVTIAFVRDWQA